MRYINLVTYLLTNCLLLLLLFFITPKAARNRHEKQHNPKHKGKNIHKHTTRSQAVARIANRTASQHLWGSLDVIGHV